MTVTIKYNLAPTLTTPQAFGKPLSTSYSDELDEMLPVSGIIQSLLDWLISFSIMSLRLKPKTFPVYEDATDGHLGCSHLLATRNNKNLFTFIYFCDAKGQVQGFVRIR